MTIFNKLERKIRCLIERIRLSENDYLVMKAQSQMYKAMMSTVKYSLNTECGNLYDNAGNLIAEIPEGKTVAIHINITEMLSEGGITFNKEVVKLKVTGI